MRFRAKRYMGAEGVGFRSHASGNIEETNVLLKKRKVFEVPHSHREFIGVYRMYMGLHME